MDKMLTKFESKSNRVKGLSFHAVRPWILASLHNGQIQLWDYRMGTCLDKFEEHDGPVRGVDFHRSQSLFVSGGDDYKVKVWDYKLKRCLFTLLGHLDYIRTVQFHLEYPWIVSASDDQTIRIWNWQSRGCISVLTGHNHYVMCAAFHPKEDMIVSASLDQTVRVWDTVGLRKKTVRGAPPQPDEATVVSKVNNELFGGNDAVVKYVLEGHERGVNWAAFHPTLPLIISGADDRQVKLWRMNETKAWEVDTMRGHTNNVSCVLFHPKHELIVSNSEDRSIRVWDISKRLGVQTFRRENDRFWILAAHPEQNLLAAGHDSGMTVFKLERERPAFESAGGKCFYVKDRYLRLHEFSSGRDLPLVSLRRASATASPGTGGGPRSLSLNALNKTEHNALIMSDAEGGSYELLTFSAEGTSSGEAQDVRRGAALAAVFVGRDRFAVLDKSRQLVLKNLQNEAVKKSALPVAGVDALFPAAGTGRLLLKTEDRVLLFDLTARKVLAELQLPRLKYVFWSADGSLVALVAKHQLVLADRNLEARCSVSETVRLKGGCWDADRPVFVYSTLNHIKYALPSGDRGILRALDAPVYPAKLQGNSLFCLDREGKMRALEIDTTEAVFKLALERRDYPEVLRLVRHSRLCGQAIVSFLTEKGFPEVALHFVHDARTRFKLALACGNLEAALAVAQDLDDEAWRQLGTEALRQGQWEIVEMAFQKTRQFDRLSFLYLVSGKTDKLRKMLKIAEMRGDAMAVVHNALFLGDVEERVRVLEATGQLFLALATARAHGLSETAERLAALVDASRLVLPPVAGGAALLLPPTPIQRLDNWPLLAAARAGEGKAALRMDDDAEAADGAAGAEGTAGGWGDDDLFDEDEDRRPAPAKAPKATEAGGGWGGDDDLDLSDDEPVAAAPREKAREAARFTAPAPGPALSAGWLAESAHCADHFAAGAAESAVTLLHRQVAAKRVEAMKSGAVALFLGSRAFLPAPAGLPPTRTFLTREARPAGSSSAAKPLPALALKAAQLLDLLKQAYRAFTAAQFADCRALLQRILAGVPLVCAASKAEGADLKEMVEVCREYLLALALKAALDEASERGDVPRSLELAAYFTHCALQPAHLLLALKTAMAAAFKNKNFINAASFARRLLDLPEAGGEKNADLRAKAQKVLQKAEQQGRNDFAIDYDERNPFTLDAAALKPIYKGAPAAKCAFCAATYDPAARGRLCAVCEVAAVGVETVGLVTQAAASRAAK